MDLLVYCLAVYLLYHVWNRSDLLIKPREWAARHAPRWALYVASCPLCFTFWTSVALWVTGVVTANLLAILAAPVVNLVLDLVVRLLIRANEPPLTVTSATSGGGDTVIGIAREAVKAGDMVTFGHLPSPSAFHVYSPPPNWIGFSDEPLARPDLIGRYVKRRSDGLIGPIREVYRCGDDCANSFQQVCYRVDVAGGSAKVEASTCDLIDEPFNPVAHEQTK